MGSHPDARLVEALRLVRDLLADPADERVRSTEQGLAELDDARLEAVC